MLRKQKLPRIEQIEKYLQENQVVFFTDFQGLDVESMTSLRRQLRKDGCRLLVTKNTFVKVIQEKLGRKDIPQSVLKGSTALVFSENDPILPAKMISNFAKEHAKPTIKGALINNIFYESKSAAKFAELPSIEQIRAQAVGAISAPLFGLVNALAGLLRSFVSQINQLSQKKE